MALFRSIVTVLVALLGASLLGAPLLSPALAQRPPTYLLVTTPELRAGEPYNGSLGRDDGQNFKDGSFVTVLKLRARAADVIDLRARAAFPVVLSLYGPDGSLVGTSDARRDNETTLALELPDTGRYVLALSGSSPADLGEFSVTLTMLEAVDNALIGFGEETETTFTGALSGRDEQQDGRYLDTFGLQIDSAGRYRIAVDSAMFDGALRLFRNDTLVAEGAGVIERRLAAGDYRLVVTTTTPDATGVYTLALSALGDTAAPLPPLPTEVDGALGDDDPQQDDRFYDDYTFVIGPDASPESTADSAADTGDAAATTEIYIALNASDFGPYLMLYRERSDGGEQLVATSEEPAADDAADESVALLETGLAPARYRLVVTTRRPGAGGDYRLSLQTAPPRAELTLSIPGEIGGTLSPDDSGPDDSGREDRYEDRYLLVIDVPTEIVATLRSEAFDAWLELRTERGELIADDDDGGDGTNARLARLLTPGRYYLVASSTFSGETGPYTLSVVPQPEP